MNIKTIGALLAGSIFVHAAVTACSSDDDASTNRPAHADDTAAVATPATCNATFPIAVGDGGTISVPYSEQAYPGKSKTEIAAHVTNWTVVDDPQSPPDYQGGLRLATNLIVRDGYAAAACTSGKTSYFVWK